MRLPQSSWLLLPALLLVLAGSVRADDPPKENTGPGADPVPPLPDESTQEMQEIMNHQHQGMAGAMMMERSADGSLEAPHAGQTVEAADRIFEIVYTDDGICLFAYQLDGQPSPMDGVVGRVRLTFTDGAVREATLDRIEMPRRPETPAWGCAPGLPLADNQLRAEVDLSQAHPGELTAQYTLEGLSGQTDVVRFHQTADRIEPGARRGATRGGGPR